ncbi:hypothetical protein R0135_17360 [Congregibacter variabilis]|uniref:Uncharacterized protein n=1 Tax=Congregibacter variabilis TaxID=3081200 RepID=A0ABZ0I634_9GAMM|nr:hypothetical protein R0135_17360 [Congregibacter sp. IMCC43200]
MRVLEAGDWGLLLPDEWQAEQEDDVIVIGDRDGVGCIEISELHKDTGDFGAEDLQQFVTEDSIWDSVRRGSFEGLRTSLIEDGAAIREWYLYAGKLLLYVTYSCELDNQGLDDAAVDDILDTLRMATQ